MQHKEFQHNKKPRIEEPDDNTYTNTSLLNMLNKRTTEQDKYSATQSNKKVKTYKKTYQVTPPRVTIFQSLPNNRTMLEPEPEP
eukprot:2795778-Heterocapsa_arctica.AAC.1